ncbi:hypothetical protein DMENIID0001_147150 [Sergentomyia squamirostris]
MRELGRSVVRKAELGRKAKMSVYQAVYVPVLTYGHDIWVMTERIRSRLQAAEMRFLRAVKGVTRSDRIRNTHIREEFLMEPLLLRVERSQLKWFGHLIRMEEERSPEQAFLAKPTGPRPRGRPRKRWADEVRTFCKRLGVTEGELVEVAEDRQKWREIVGRLIPRP